MHRHLVMMVRNEPTIIETLASVPWIDSATIVDMGPSIDDTVARARRILGPKAKIHTERWPGRFDEARNVTLGHARRNAPPGSLLVLLDGEDVWEGPRPERPGRTIMHKGDGWIWCLPRVVSRELEARYVGATHEHLDIAGVMPIVGRIRCNMGGSPEPVQRAKWRRDIKLLRAHPSPRGTFYTALMRQWLGEYAVARKLFERVIKGDGWEEEKYEAFVRMAQMAETREDVIAWLLDTHDRWPHRAEPLFWLAEQYARRNWFLCFDFARQAVRCTTPKDFLFLWEPAYEDASRELLMRAARHVGETVISRQVAHEILDRRPTDVLALYHARLSAAG